MPQISTDLLRYRIGIAAQEGADPEEIIRRAGVASDIMTTTREYFDAADELRLWRAIVETTGREDIGLVCGLQFPTQVMNMVGYVMVNAPDLRTSVERLARYQRLMGDTMGLFVEEEENGATAFIDLWSPWHDQLRYTIDTFITAVMSWTDANTPGIVKPLRVGFHYERPSDTTPYEKVFAPAPVTFGAERSHLVFALEAMDAPILGASSAMLSYFDDKVAALLRDHEGRDTWAFKVRQRLLEGLKGATPAVEDIAGELAVSVRKLQQKLKEEGVSFTALLNDARRDLAAEYLTNSDVSKSEIAYLLGFSEVSVFSRSFKKWTGLTPSDYVERHRATPD